MILRLDDWKKYPNAILHSSTTNRSWVKLAHVYREMGIKNYGFHLALHNPKLEAIDPHDENISEQDIVAIVLECKENPWYFFREVLRVPTPGSPVNNRIRANRFNVAAWWLFFNHITTLCICPRQTGKSLAMESLDVYILAVGGVSTEIHLLTKDDDLRLKTIVKLKEMLEGLPPYLILRSKDDTYNTEKLSIHRLGNVYHTSVAQHSIKSANNVGRGLTVAIHRIDEFAFIKNIEVSLPALLASASAARDSAEANGSFYGNMFATTAGYLSSAEGRFAYKIYKSCSRWTENFFDTSNLNELKSIVKKHNNEGAERVLCEFNHRMLGYSDEWLKSKIEESMADPVKAEAEFLNVWAGGNERSPISREHLRAITDSIDPDPYLELSEYGYIIRWYVDDYEGRKLVLGIDTSDASGSDDIGLIFRDVSTGEVVGAGNYNETNLVTFSTWVANILISNENVTLIIERRSTGHTVLSHLILLLPAHGIDPFKRIFNWAVNEMDGVPHFNNVVNMRLSSRDDTIYTKYLKEFGYATSSSGRSSRENLYGHAFSASVKYTGSMVRDKLLSEQLSTLVRKNNRIDHNPGDHDDMVVAWLLTYWFLTNAKNLHVYGIQPRTILSAIRLRDENNQEISKEQQELITELDMLVEDIQSEPNKLKREKLITKLKFLAQYLEEDNTVKFNIDSALGGKSYLHYQN